MSTKSGKERRPSPRTYRAVLRDRTSVMPLGTFSATSPNEAAKMIMKAYKGLLPKLGCGNYRIELTDTVSQHQSEWPLDQLLNGVPAVAAPSGP